jgi:hypothetical protein
MFYNASTQTLTHISKTLYLLSGEKEPPPGLAKAPGSKLYHTQAHRLSFTPQKSHVLTTGHFVRAVPSRT